ncbi:MAG: hypothetical protein A4E38_00603 [Methanoregulaceae archaeon PtaB.Bin108]|nr:MAG: hypothetical protein A4E38_00603 [Methanoregulaceae archaeon PtaB.Bin108]
MEKMKTLVVLLAVTLAASLAGNLFFILNPAGSPVTNQVRDYLLYPYPQVEFPGNNTTLNSSASHLAVNRNSSPEMNISTAEVVSDNPNSTIIEMLQMLEEEGALNESILMMILGIDEEGAGYVEVTPTVEPGPTPDPYAWKNYSSTKWHFTMPYPPSWEIKEGSSSNPALTITAPVETECSTVTSECYQYVASVVVSIDQNPGTTVLEDYFNRKVSSLQKSLGITATSKSALTTISGNNAYWIEYYTRDARGNPLKWYMQYYSLIDKKVFILTYSGPYSTGDNIYSANKPDAQKMIDSFTVERQYKVV